MAYGDYVSTLEDRLPMTGIRIGDKWNVDPTDLRLRPYEETNADLAALTQVRNETLRATTLPEDYRDYDTRRDA